MKKILLLTLMIAVLSVANSAHALTFTLWQDALLMADIFIESETGIASIEAQEAVANGGVYFAVNFNRSTDPYRWVGIGLEQSDLTGYTSYAQSFLNFDNELSWDYAVGVIADGILYGSDWVTVAAGATGTPSINFADYGIDPSTIQGVGFGVQVAEPALTPAGDWQTETAHLVSYGVPEPATLGLVGTGLLGLLAFRRKRAKA